jgi:hypothetical protein
MSGHSEITESERKNKNILGPYPGKEIMHKPECVPESGTYVKVIKTFYYIMPNGKYLEKTQEEQRRIFPLSGPIVTV